MHTQQAFQVRFPAQRAFVVQVAGPQTGAADAPLGRVEHVMSGHAVEFASWAACVAFIEQVVAAEWPPALP